MTNYEDMGFPFENTPGETYVNILSRSSFSSVFFFAYLCQIEEKDSI
jgi:hypothetical protein